MPLHLGTSGWQYRHWRATFYPQKVPQKSWLEFYAARFDTVELNNSFYMLPKAEAFAAWAARTPPGFCFAVKASRFLTHVKKLAEPEEPVKRLLERAEPLGEKLGPILLQLPPTLQVDAARLDQTLRQFPRGMRVAVEFRHPTWFTDEVRGLLERHRSAMVLADSPARVTPAWRTADWGYMRFHEGKGRPRPCYPLSSLRQWSGTLAEMWRSASDLYVYFNNDPRACALRDAVRFGAMMAGRGWSVGRTPARREIRVGDASTAAWLANRSVASS